MKKIFLLIFSLSLISFSCSGTDNTKTGNTTQNSDSEELTFRGAIVVQSDLTLPGCDSKTEGQLFYVLEDEEFQYCDGSKFQVIDLTGPAGADGQDGTNGIDGNDGVSINWLGSLYTPPVSPNLNDAYHNLINGVAYIYDGSSWNIIVDNENTDSLINGLVAYFPFSGNRNDVLSNITNITESGGVLTSDKNNDTDKAYEFDGSKTDRILYETTSLNNVTEFTLTMWLYPTSNSNGDYIGTVEFLQTIDSNKIFESIIMGPAYGSNQGKMSSKFFPGSSECDISSTTVLPLNSWTQISYVFSGNNYLKIYVNGIQEDISSSCSVENVGLVNIIKVSGTIDGSSSSSSGILGKIDEIYVYNRALSGNEIAKIYNNAD